VVELRRLVALAAVLALAGCASDGSRPMARTRPDAPLLVPWSRVGDISLGEPRTRVEAEYGRERGFYYVLHGSKVWVDYYRGRVADIEFSTPYYRTRSGFGVGSRIPLGPCHRTATSRCEHRWHGFVFGAYLREGPCPCWAKAGRGGRSLPLSGASFTKPWTIINVRRGRVTSFRFSARYID
jgi:hypothetical protein